MAKTKQAPELVFQKHIASYLKREHGYGVLEQSDITDTEHFIAEDLLWAFLKATQADTLKKLEEDYSTDARDEVFKALRKELERKPLCMILRDGLEVKKSVRLLLYYPKPRSAASAGAGGYAQNRITFRPHFYFGAVAPGQAPKEIDFVFLLNGLPIVDLELKHEANQNVHDAVKQFADRDHQHKIFSHPFLYLAADTSDVMAATDPRRVENFRWHNMGLTNVPTNPDEYPVEFLYREVLSKEQLLEALSFFLVRVPKREAEADKPERPAFTIFPRYHQARLVRKVAEDISAHYAKTGNIGRKYLAEHSPGSGKTLSICWLADRLHSLFKPGTNEKLVDITFILTDRKALDTNVREDMENFTHLKDIVGFAKKAEDLPRFLKERKPVIVTTQQKLAYVLEELQKNPALKALRVAFLIDEAHRSQEGQMGAAIRLPFRKPTEPDAEAPELDPEEQLAKVIREHDINQLFVAFTATPSQATLDLFGNPFDSYTEAEAIAEGYIVDVAAKGDHKAHLAEPDAKSLLERAIATYMGHHRDTKPERVVVHKSSRYWPEELKGFQAGLNGIPRYDFVTIERMGDQFMRLGYEPPLRGTVISLHRQRHVVFTSGYIPHLGTYPGNRIPNPIEIVEHHGDSTPEALAKDIMALTKLNWNSCSFASAEPMTLHFARTIGRILTEIPEGTPIQDKYRFYM